MTREVCRYISFLLNVSPLLKYCCVLWQNSSDLSVILPLYCCFAYSIPLYSDTMDSMLKWKDFLGYIHMLLLFLRRMSAVGVEADLVTAACHC